MKSINSKVSATSLFNSKVTDNSATNSRCLRPRKREKCSTLDKGNDSNKAPCGAECTKGDVKDPQKVKMSNSDLCVSRENQKVFDSTDHTLQPNMRNIEQNKGKIGRNIIQVYWSVVETRMGRQEVEETMQSSESNTGSTQDQAIPPPSRVCSEESICNKRFEETHVMDCRKNCPGIFQKDQTVEECRPEKGRSTCLPKDANECRKCLSENGSDASEISCYPSPGTTQCMTVDVCDECHIEKVTITQDLDRTEDHLDGAVDHVDGAVDHLDVAEDHVDGAVDRAVDHVDGAVDHLDGAVDHLDAAEYRPDGAEDHLEVAEDRMDAAEKDLDGPEDDWPCSRPECPGKGASSEPSAADLGAVCAPKPGEIRCDEVLKECGDCNPTAAIQKSVVTCAPQEGKNKCDDQSPVVCDACQGGTTNKLFDNDAVCKPKSGSKQCDPQSSTYCIQCVQMIKPGLHHGPQSETVKCYESYKRECVVCAAAKSGQQTPLNVPLCTPYMTRVHHSGPEGVLCEECMEDAMRSQNTNDDVCRPMAGEEWCNLTAVECEECTAMAARNAEQDQPQPPQEHIAQTVSQYASINECFPQPGMESCGEEFAKLCEECLREADNLSKATKSVLSCGPVPGQEKCDDEIAKLCKKCYKSKISPEESVFKCDPQPGNVFCTADNAQVCGCASRRLAEKDDLTVKTPYTKDDSPTQDFTPATQDRVSPKYETTELSEHNMPYLVCNQEPGSRECGTSNLICEECKSALNTQKTYERTGTACGKCPSR